MNKYESVSLEMSTYTVVVESANRRIVHCCICGRVGPIITIIKRCPSGEIGCSAFVKEVGADVNVLSTLGHLSYSLIDCCLKNIYLWSGAAAERSIGQDWTWMLFPWACTSR